MTLMTLFQVLFYIQVTALSATALDDSEREAVLILSFLENQDALPGGIALSKTKAFERNNPLYMRKVDNAQILDTFQNHFDKVNSYYNNILETKPKRGWEDLSIAWRRSPKRAWEIVNRLWQMPDIRRRYRNFRNKGKRSEEVMENIPVQQDNQNPTWMIDEIGYDIDLDHPVAVGPKDNNGWYIKNLKRGWEDIGPLRGHRFNWRRSPSNRRAYRGSFGKRGWEEIAWKRNSGDTNTPDASQRGTNGDASNFGYNMVPTSGEDEQELTNMPQSIIDIVIPGRLASSNENKFEKHLINPGDLVDGIGVFENNYDETKIPKDLTKHDQEYEIAQKEWDTDEYLKRSSYSRLCRIVFGNASKCSDMPDMPESNEGQIKYE